LRAPKGNTYRIIKTTETDPGDEPLGTGRDGGAEKPDDSDPR
jgi:hypothetical protein